MTCSTALTQRSGFGVVRPVSPSNGNIARRTTNFVLRRSYKRCSVALSLYGHCTSVRGLHFRFTEALTERSSHGFLFHAAGISVSAPDSSAASSYRRCSTALSLYGHCTGVRGLHFRLTEALTERSSHGFLFHAAGISVSAPDCSVASSYRRCSTVPSSFRPHQRRSRIVRTPCRRRGS
jgi:hypothetical protein